MSMRTHALVTHLRPDEALTVIELLDQLRAVLMHAYGEDIRTLLQQASAIQEPATTALQEGEPF